MSLSENISSKLFGKMGPFKLFLCLSGVILLILFFLIQNFSEYQNMTDETMNRIKTADSQAGDR